MKLFEKQEYVFNFPLVLMIMKIFLTLTLVTTSLLSFGQKEDPTSWSVSVSKSDVHIGETVELIFQANIDEGWYLYSSDFDPNLGPVVATFSFSKSSTYERVGKIQPIGAKSKEDLVIWMGTYTYFLHHAEFRQKVKILEKNPVIKVKLNGQACNDESGKCVPVIKQFVFDQIHATEKKAKPEQPGISTVEPSGQVVTDNTLPAYESFPPLSPSMSLSELIEEKQKLEQKGPNGKDPVIDQLEQFARKYGRNSK